MIKSSLLANNYYDNTVRKSIKWRWFPILIFTLILCYAAFRLLEPNMLGWMMKVFPQEPDKSTEFYRDFLNIVFNEILWLAGFLLVAWVYVVYAPFSNAIHRTERGLLVKYRLVAGVIITLSFLASLFVAYKTLNQFPNSSDEYAYLFQARTMAQGKLWEASHDLGDFFYFNHIAQKDGISVSRFPPGWPAIMAAAVYVGIDPILVNPILGAILLIVFFSFVIRFYNPQVALWSLIALALSSFYIFNSGSFFSHTSCALFALCFVYGSSLYFEKQNPKYLLLAGFFLAMVAITRYFTAILIFIPFFFAYIGNLKLQSIKAFFWLGIGALPCIAFLFWYNHAITGNALLPVTMWAYSDESLGFVRGHTVMKGIEHVVRWLGMFVYWCSPAILIFYIISLVDKLKDPESRLIHPEDYLFIVLIGGYFFYYQIGGNQYGPRFMFEALPFMIVFVVNRVLGLNKKWITGLLVAGLLLAFVKFPFISWREHRVVEERNDLYNLVAERKIQNAVVFISSYTSVVRPMPTGDLTRNDVYFLNDVLYALDLRERNHELMEYYPDRHFYRYVREVNDEHGKLIRIR